MRRRLFTILITLVMVTGVTPAMAAPSSGSVGVVSSSDGPVVPRPSVSENPPERLAERPVVSLPDPDVGRNGFEHGSAARDLPRGGYAELGGLPITVDVAAEVFDAGVRVDAEIADPAIAASISPYAQLAARVDLTALSSRSPSEVPQAESSRRASVTLDYSQVPLGYGAGIVDRMTVYEVSDCVTLIDEMVCAGEWVELPNFNNTRDRTITFEIEDTDLRPGGERSRAAMASPRISVVGAPNAIYWDSGPGDWYVVGSSLSGPQGDFSATPLAPIADYQVGLYTGTFQVTYPIEVPPAFFGPEASIGLSYDSGTTDGMVGTVNTQASAVGLGWSFHPGSITRLFRTCKSYRTWNSSSNDLCPTSGEIFYLTLNGVSSRLVEVDTTNRIFRLENDQFWELQLYNSGGSNRDSENEWWELRTPDGRTYQFGKDDGTYSSTQDIHVFVPNGENPNEWCDDTTNVYCAKAYQWNLEKVTDVDGYTMEFFWTREMNYYKVGLSTVEEYVRAAHVDYILYGDGPGKDDHAKVDFTYDERCFETTCDDTDPQDYPDTPVDLACGSGSCSLTGPSYWTQLLLSDIETFVSDDGSNWDAVDHYELSHEFPTVPEDPDGDENLTKLWLTGIQRLSVSEVGTDAVVADLPAMEFNNMTLDNHLMLPNRLWYVTSSAVVAPGYMPRISYIKNELGGVTTVTYGRSHDCAEQGNGYDTSDVNLDDWPFGNDADNDVEWAWATPNVRRECDSFPGRDPNDHNAWVYWRKWKVMQVTQVGDYGNPDVTTTYDYRIEDGNGDPTAGPIWKYNLNEVYSADSVWDDFRGHSRVKVIDDTGAYQIHTFYQGMEGDHWPGPNANYPTLDDDFQTTDGSTWTDYNYLAGQTAEVHAYDSSDNDLTRTVTEYYAAELDSGMGNYYTRPDTVTDTVFGSPNVTSSVEYTYNDNHGNPTQVLYNGTAGDDPVVEQTSYLQSSTHDLMYLPRWRKLWNGSSPGTNGDEAAMVSYFYDGHTNNATQPTDGRLTKTRYFSQRDPSNEYVETQTAYDATSKYPVTYTDPNGIDTTFTYDADFGSMTSQAVDDGGTDELTTTYTVHPGRGLIWTMTDENSANTKWVYDQLGRLDEVFRPVQYGGPDPSLRFAYSNFTSSSPALTRTETLQESGTSDVYLDTYEYTDGFGRSLQTQTWYDGDGDGTADDRVVTLTRTDTVGRVAYQTTPFVDTSGGAGSGLVAPPTVQWLELDGAGDGASATVPSITGDMEIRARVAMDDYTPPSNQVIASQYEVGGYKNHILQVNSDGTLSYYISTDGSATSHGYTASTNLSSVATDGEDIELRATFDRANGEPQWLTLDGSGDAASATVPAITGDMELSAKIAMDDYTPASNEVIASQYEIGNKNHILQVNSNGTLTYYISADGTYTTHGYTASTNLSSVATDGEDIHVRATFDRDNDEPQWLELDGAGDGASASVSAITGDLEIRAKVAMDDYTPAHNMVIASQYEFGNKNHILQVNSAGTLSLYISTDGTNTAHGYTASTNLSSVVSDGQDVHVRVTFDRNNGSGQSVARFYYKLTDGAGWTELGTAQTWNTVSSLYASTFAFKTGLSRTSSDSFDGKVYYVEWYNGIAGSLRAAPHFDDPVEWPDGGPNTDLVSNSWSRIGNAALGGDAASEVHFYYKLTDEGSWTALGSVQSWQVVDSLYASTFAFKTGISRVYQDPFDGKIYWVEWRDGIDGTIRANPHFDDPDEWNDTGPNTDSAGRSWSLFGDAAIDGPSASEVNFYYRFDPSDSWTALGTTQTWNVVSSLHNSSWPFKVGQSRLGSDPFGGKIYWVEWRDGIGGTIRANPQFDDNTQWPDDGPNTDSAGRSWSLLDDATVAGVTQWDLDSYTHTTYDALSRVTDVDAMSHGTVLFSTQTDYGTATNQTWVKTTDPDSRWIARYSDGFGRLIKVEEPGSPSNAITTYTYTPRSELETVTDAASNVISIDYDLLGRKTAMSDPDMGDWSYGYDDAGNLTTQTDGRGITLTFAYDNLNRITSRKQATTTLAEWFYGNGSATNNRAGRLTKTRINGNDTDATYEIDGYNANGEITSEQWTIDSDSYDIDYTYTADGKIDTITYPLVPGESTREVVTHGWDTLGRPSSLTGDQTYVDSATWTPQGLPDTWDLGPSASGIERSWTYDTATLRVNEYLAGTTQLSGDSSRNIMDLTYSYEDSGNVTSIVDGMNSGQRECYEYDTLNRLTRGFTGNSTCTTYDGSTGDGVYDESYTYTSIHNINTFAGTSYTYGTGNDSGTGDAGPHAVTDVGTAIDLEYDDNGNRTKKTEGSDVTDYVYNDENRLESVTMPNSETIEMVYAADGQRVSRTNGDHSTVYVAGLLEVDSDGSGVTDSRTFYGFAGVQVTVRAHDGVDTTFVTQNHLGSAVAAFNDDTDGLALARYHPWGTERSSAGTQPSDHRFTGQVADDTSAASAGTGLLFFNARYQDPTSGQFTAPDDVVPNLATPADLNRYAYARNSPTRWADPTGHTVCADRYRCMGPGSTSQHRSPRSSSAGARAVLLTSEMMAFWGSAGSEFSGESPGFAGEWTWVFVYGFPGWGPGDIKDEMSLLVGSGHDYVVLPSDPSVEFRQDIFGNVLFGYVASATGLNHEEIFWGNWMTGATGLQLNDRTDWYSIELGIHLWEEFRLDLGPNELEAAIVGNTAKFFFAADIDFVTSGGTFNPGARWAAASGRANTPGNLWHRDAVTGGGRQVAK